MGAASWSTFEPFTGMHLAVVLTAASLTAMACLIGRRLGTREPSFRRVLGAMALAVWVAHSAWWLLPMNFVWGRSLPIHLCDIGGAVAAWALLRPGPRVRALLYFWGLVLSAQGFITPVLSEGPATVIFWFFWASHLMIVGGAVYDVVAGGHRPTSAMLCFSLAVSLTYLAATFMLNLATGWNYGYTGRPSMAQGTAVDLFGPWPWRVGVMAVAGSTGFALAWLPWGIAAARRRVGSGDGPRPDDAGRG